MRRLIPIEKIKGKERCDIVRFCDRIRHELDDLEEMAEFCWFAREYPRCFRHHLSHAEYRLREIHLTYKALADEMLSQVKDGSYEFGISNSAVNTIYYNFESLINACGSALDILARIVGLAYRNQTPPSFNGICQSKAIGGPIEILRESRLTWVLRMKEYRDCFVHYTPVDTLLMAKLIEFRGNWKMVCKIPNNPRAKDITRFKYTRSRDLLKYAICTVNNLNALEGSIAKCLEELYSNKGFPIRINSLFSIGA